MADPRHPSDGPIRELEEVGTVSAFLASDVTPFAIVPEVHFDSGWTAQSLTPLRPTVGQDDPG